MILVLLVLTAPLWPVLLAVAFGMIADARPARPRPREMIEPDPDELMGYTVEEGDAGAEIAGQAAARADEALERARRSGLLPNARLRGRR